MSKKHEVSFRLNRLLGIQTLKLKVGFQRKTDAFLLSLLIEKK